MCFDRGPDASLRMMLSRDFMPGVIFYHLHHAAYVAYDQDALMCEGFAIERAGLLTRINGNPVFVAKQSHLRRMANALDNAGTPMIAIHRDGECPECANDG